MHHMKKMIAPILVTVLVLGYYISIAVFLITANDMPVVVRILIAGIAILLSAVMIGVFISRIKEIQGGGEDDLSKY